jgi:hypothetical protein
MEERARRSTASRAPEVRRGGRAGGDHTANGVRPGSRLREAASAATLGGTPRRDLRRDPTHFDTLATRTSRPTRLRGGVASAPKARLATWVRTTPRSRRSESAQLAHEEMGELGRGDSQQPFPVPLRSCPRHGGTLCIGLARCALLGKRTDDSSTANRRPGRLVG